MFSLTHQRHRTSRITTPSGGESRFRIQVPNPGKSWEKNPDWVTNMPFNPPGNCLSTVLSSNTVERHVMRVGTIRRLSPPLCSTLKWCNTIFLTCDLYRRSRFYIRKNQSVIKGNTRVWPVRPSVRLSVFVQTHCPYVCGVLSVMAISILHLDIYKTKKSLNFIVEWLSVLLFITEE